MVLGSRVGKGPEDPGVGPLMGVPSVACRF